MHKYLPVAICLLYSSIVFAQIPYIDSKEMLSKGIELHDKGEYKKSIELYRQVHECDTNYTLAVYEQVLSLTSDSAFEAAKALALLGLKLPKSDKREFNLALAALYDYLDKSDSALLLYNQLQEAYPHDYRPWYEKGIIYMRKKNYDVALKCFEHSLLIDPNHYSSHYMTGLIYSLQGRLSEGFIALELSLLMTGDQAYARKSIALISSLTEQTDEVVKLYHEKKEQYSHPLFDDIDQVVNSKLALNTDYKLKMSLDDGLFRQSQAILEKLKFDPSDTNFVMQYYVPLLTEIFRQDMFEAFILLNYSGLGFEKVENVAEKRKKDIEAVKQLVFPYFQQIQATRELNFDKRQKAVPMYHYYPNDNIIVVGPSANGDSKDLVVGDVEILRSTYSLRNRGHFDPKGEKDGWWYSYYASGELRAKEHYTHGVQTDSSYVFFENGNVKDITVRDRDGTAKVEFEFDVEGWLSEKKVQVNEKIVDHWSYFPNGQLEYKEQYDARKVTDGTYKIYYRDGRLKKELSYKDGEISGHWRFWHPNGQLQEETDYENGKIDGTDVEYYETGVVKEKSVYKRGKPDGTDEKFDENGRLTEKYVFSNGKIEEIDRFTPSGRLYGQLKFKGGVPYYIKYTDNDGKVVSEKEEKGGISAYRHYFANGRVQADLKLNENGNREGLQTYYYETGPKKEETNYKDDNLEGSSVTYFKNGNIKEEENYKENELDGYYKSFYAGGALQSEGWYKAGKRQGLWKFYYVNGKLENEQYFLNGKIDGYNKEYNVKGELVNKYLYDYGEVTAHVCYDTAGRMTDSVCYNPIEGSYKATHWSRAQAVNDMEYSLKYGSVNGLFRKRYVNGLVSEESYFRNGRRDSISINYYPDGKRHSEGSYRDGNKVGAWKYFSEAGQLWREEHYNNSGDMAGPTRSYTCNRLRLVSNFKNGALDSAQVYFGEEGKMALIVYYDNGVFTGYTYEGKDGKLLPLIKAGNSTTKVTGYYRNGQKSAEMTIEQNLLTGPYRVYFSDGKLAEESNYNMHFDLDGPVHHYYPDGKPAMELEYKDNEQVGEEKTYNPDGSLLVYAKYYCGELDGPVVVSDPKSGTSEKYFYHAGRLTSSSK